METQSRYRLVGSFTLATIFAGFAFVYWLYNAGGIGNRATYKVHFESSVSGLLVGSAVLFNGIRVGEVSRLQLNHKKPKQVIATIKIEPDTPIAPDTVVELEFQGLASAPAINLIGGDQLREEQSPSPGNVVVLRAGSGAGESIAHSATRVLRRLDNVVATNAEPFQKLIENLEKFSGALAKNANRVDGIVAGIERLTGGATAARKRRIYELMEPAITKSQGRPFPGLLVVDEPTVLIAYNTDKILVRREDGVNTVIGDAKWSDNLPNIVQSKVVRSFENAGYLKYVSRPADGTSPDLRLLLDIRRFHVLRGAPSAAEIQMLAKVVGNSGRILDAKLFTARISIETSTTASAIEAINTAFSKVANKLIPWVITAARKVSPPSTDAN